MLFATLSVNINVFDEFGERCKWQTEAVYDNNT